MKYLIIGDIHGNPVWKDIVAKESYDKVIFLGDYVDTHQDISVEQQINNLNDILDFKEANPDSVILLRGNHCSQYGFHYRECSGFNNHTNSLFPSQRYIANTQWIYVLDNIVFSHAGISQRWMDYCRVESLDKINDMNYMNFMFNGGPWDCYGTDPQQGPTWIRPETLKLYNITDYDQVVGHTPDVAIRIMTDTVDSRTIWVCDCLMYNPDYLVLEDGIFTVKSLNNESTSNQQIEESPA